MTRGDHRGALRIDEPSGPRFDLALERFAAGQPFEFHDVAFHRDRNGTVYCRIDSSWALENVTPATAAQDLGKAEATLRELVAASVGFASAVECRQIRYELISDYGMGAVLICWRAENQVTWAAGLPRRAG